MLVKLAELPQIREKHKEQKMILAGGAFDILHQGHIDYLRDLKKQCDVLVIAIKSDAEVRSYKEPGRPIQNEDVRAAIIDAIKYVDYVVVAPEPVGDLGFAEPPRLTVARTLRPDILATISERWRPFEQELRTLGVQLMLVPIEKVNSTSSIIERIRGRPDA